MSSQISQYANKRSFPPNLEKLHREQAYPEICFPCKNVQCPYRREENYGSLCKMRFSQYENAKMKPNSKPNPNEQLLRNIEIGITEALQEAEALEKINDLFRNTKYIVIVEVNGYRITLDKDFSFLLKFNCGHTRQMHISEMLSYQKSCPNKHVLLTRWQSILSSETSLTTSFSCDKCKQAKARKLSIFRRHTPKDTIGTASMSLRVI